LPESNSCDAGPTPSFHSRINNSIIALPVAPVRRGHLHELHLPCFALLYPHRTEVLVARRRTLILGGRNPQHNVIGHDGDVIAHRHDFHVVRQQVDAAPAHLIDHVLPLREFAVEIDERKIVSESALKKRRIALLRGRDKTLFGSEERLLQRSQRLRRRGRLAERRSYAKQNDRDHPTVAHQSSLNCLSFREAKRRGTCFSLATPAMSIAKCRREFSRPARPAPRKPAPRSPDSSAQTSPPSLRFHRQ